MDKAYKYFMEVAEAGSISAAAQKLHVSQPALSLSIKQLETELKTELLVRSRRGVSLTDEGQLVYDKLLSLRVAEKNLLDSVDARAGRNSSVTIGAIDSIALSLVSEIDLSDKDTNLLVDNTTNLIELVSSGLIDVSYITKPQKEMGNLNFQPIGNEEMVIVAKDDINDNKLPLLAYNKSSNTYRHIHEALISAGLKPRPVFHSTDPHLLVEAARLGKGATVIPKVLFEKVGNTGVKRVFDDVTILRPIVRVARQDRWLPDSIGELEQNIVKRLS